jgi:hypothetical protein
LQKKVATFEKIDALFEKIDALFLKNGATFGKPVQPLLQPADWGVKLTADERTDRTVVERAAGLRV